MAKAKIAEKPPKPANPDAAANAAAPPDERDAAIARLERAVAEERQNAATLREENNALKFKLEILEKSYAKQLADARQKMETAQKGLAGHEARLKELGTGGEDTLRLVSEMRAELNQVKAERNLLKEQRNRGGNAPAATRDDAADSSGSQTINAMIMNAGLTPTREREASGDSNLKQRVRAEEPPSVEMLSPDLIFTKSDKDDDDEKPR
jgi:chromosome segregation ATPase